MIYLSHDGHWIGMIYLSHDGHWIGMATGRIWGGVLHPRSTCGQDPVNIHPRFVPGFPTRILRFPDSFIWMMFMFFLKHRKRTEVERVGRSREREGRRGGVPRVQRCVRERERGGTGDLWYKPIFRRK